jgi:hypothetical protein
MRRCINLEYQSQFLPQFFNTKWSESFSIRIYFFAKND